MFALLTDPYELLFIKIIPNFLQVRLLMKQHAFVREGIKKVVSYKPHSEAEYRPSKYSQFLYFLFAPTIVYRDEYPR